MKNELIIQKLKYAFYTKAPFGVASFLASIYLAGLSLYQTVAMDKPVGLGWLCIHLCITLAIFLLPWGFVAVRRWLPASILIPTDKKDYMYQVRLSTSSIFSQKGQLVLSYNRNNLAGGLMIKRPDGGSEPSLMAQFMHRYFPLEGDDSPLAFDMDLFKKQYYAEATKLYCADEKNDVKILDKTKYPIYSCYKKHAQTHPDVKLPEQKEDYDLSTMFPRGCVLALSLPPNKENREYAFLLGNTWYHLPSPDDSHPSIKDLALCLNTLWHVASYHCYGEGGNLCMPFLGKGKGGLPQQSYALLWEIVFSWRKALPEGAKPDYGLNICIPVDDMVVHGISLTEVTHFLTFALKTH